MNSVGGNGVFNARDFQQALLKLLTPRSYVSPLGGTTFFSRMSYVDEARFFSAAVLNTMRASMQSRE